MVNNRSWNPKFNMVPRSKWKCKDWYRARLNEFRKKFGYFSENSGCVPPSWNNEDRSEDEFKSKV